MNHPLFNSQAGLKGNGIQLTTASGVHAINIAEYILMMMLALAHKLPVAFQLMNRAEWGEKSLFMPRELHGATAGIVGYGAIGRQTAQLCRNLGMRVLAMRRTAPETQGQVTFYAPERLKEFLGECDYVALTLPLTSVSRHLIDAAALAAMKHSACLINISRGDIVDEVAMIAALQTGRLASAALDVFAREPLPLDSPLWHMDNVIVTPHIAGITPNYGRRAAELFVDNLHRYIAGDPLVNNVDFARGY
ncbi:MAG: D-2-hydroxyacid dehydrogenase [Chloroflexi bacterium]|nr:D-2-hydroxyacid dehydrogenase [Chloroflexota bacterium]